MTLTETSSLPPIDVSPVHVQITILPDRNEYVAYVIVDMGVPCRFPIHLKPHDVKNLNTELQKAIQLVANTFGQPDVYSMSLAELASMGNFAFKSIFSDNITKETIRNALRAGTIIQIVSEDFFIPWELLYDGPLDARAHISYYWGMQHIISRTIIQDARPGALAPSLIQTPRPHVGLVACDQLPFVTQQEIPALRKLHRSKRIQLSPLRSLSPMNQRDKELAALGHFFGQKHDIVHFACHAFEEEPIHQSRLVVTKDFAITIKDFVVSEFKIAYNPFVILNACLTSIINPLYTSFWAAEFWKRGARGVLATDFHVPDWFAAAFSEELYQQLLSGKPIGEALLAIRRTFWEKQGNPLGLAYALYSSPSIRISTSN